MKIYFLIVNLNYVKFSNAGIEMIDDYLNQGIDSEEISLDLLVFFTIFPSNLINNFTTFY